MDAHVEIIARSAELANRNQPSDWEFIAEFIDAELDAAGLMICSKKWHNTICENAYDSGKLFGIAITQDKEG